MTLILDILNKVSLTRNSTMSSRFGKNCQRRPREPSTNGNFRLFFGVSGAESRTRPRNPNGSVRTRQTNGSFWTKPSKLVSILEINLNKIKNIKNMNRDLKKELRQHRQSEGSLTRRLSRPHGHHFRPLHLHEPALHCLRVFREGHSAGIGIGVYLANSRSIWPGNRRIRSFPWKNPKSSSTS